MAILISIEISPTTLELVPGSTVQFNVTGTYNDQTTQDLTPQVTYSASLGTIQGDGYYTAGIAGIGSVTATVSGFSAACQVVCDQMSTISPGNASTIPGQTVLVLGIVSGLIGRSYYVPYDVSSLVTAATFYGNGTRLTQAIGEILRQQAVKVMVVAIPDETQYPQLFDSILNLPFDILVPAGLTANSTRVPLYTTFAQTREQIGVPITIVMPVDSSPGVSVLTNNPIGALAGVNMSTYPPYSNARYFVFTPDTLTINPNIPSQYQADAAPSIAGIMSRNTPWTAITGQQILGALLYSSQFDNLDSQALAAAGYTVLRQSPRRGLCVTLGVTGASSLTSNLNYSLNFQRLTSIRIANYTLAVMSNALSVFVGNSQGNTIISTAIEVLKNLKTAGVILASDYNISIAQTTGTATVQYSILVPYEVTAITLQSMVGQVFSS